MKNSTNNSEAK